MRKKIFKNKTLVIATFLVAALFIGTTMSTAIASDKLVPIGSKELPGISGLPIKENTRDESNVLDNTEEDKTLDAKKIEREKDIAKVEEDKDESDDGTPPCPLCYKIAKKDSLLNTQTTSAVDDVSYDEKVNYIKRLLIKEIESVNGRNVKENGAKITIEIDNPEEYAKDIVSEISSAGKIDMMYAGFKKDDGIVTMGIGNCILGAFLLKNGNVWLGGRQMEKCFSSTSTDVASLIGVDGMSSFSSVSTPSASAVEAFFGEESLFSTALKELRGLSSLERSKVYRSIRNEGGYAAEYLISSLISDDTNVMSIKNKVSALSKVAASSTSMISSQQSYISGYKEAYIDTVISMLPEKDITKEDVRQILSRSMSTMIENIGTKLENTQFSTSIGNNILGAQVASSVMSTSGMAVSPSMAAAAVGGTGCAGALSSEIDELDQAYKEYKESGATNGHNDFLKWIADEHPISEAAEDVLDDMWENINENTGNYDGVPDDGHEILNFLEDLGGFFGAIGSGILESICPNYDAASAAAAASAVNSAASATSQVSSPTQSSNSHNGSSSSSNSSSSSSSSNSEEEPQVQSQGI